MFKGNAPGWMKNSDLDERVTSIANRLEEFREGLYLEYFHTDPQMRLDFSNYSCGCAAPLIFFQNIQASREVWDSLPLQQATTSMGPPRLLPPPAGVDIPDLSGMISVGSRQESSKRKSLHPDDGISGPSLSRLTLTEDDEDQPGPSKRIRYLRPRPVKRPGGGA